MGDWKPRPGDRLTSWRRHYKLWENQDSRGENSSSSETPSTTLPFPKREHPNIWTAVSKNKTYGIKFAPLGKHRMIANETRAMRALRSANVTPDYVESFVDREKFVYALVFEWLIASDWISLKYFLESNRKLLDVWTLKECRHFWNKLLATIDIIHSHNIIHGDIKDSHIFINNENNQVLLVDFGLAQFKNDPTNYFRGGSHGFAPPDYWDYIRDSQDKAIPLDWNNLRQIDLYSCAATLYYAHTNRSYLLANPSFGHLSNQWQNPNLEIFSDAVQKSFNKATGSEEIPNELKDIFNRGLHSQKILRPTTVSELKGGHTNPRKHVIGPDWKFSIFVALALISSFVFAPGPNLRFLLGFGLATCVLFFNLIIYLTTNLGSLMSRDKGSKLLSIALPLFMLSGAISQIYYQWNWVWLGIVWICITLVVLWIVLQSKSKSNHLAAYLAFFSLVALPFQWVYITPFWIGLSLKNEKMGWLVLSPISALLHVVITILRNAPNQTILMPIYIFQLTLYILLHMMVWVFSSYFSRELVNKPQMLHWKILGVLLSTIVVDSILLMKISNLMLLPWQTNECIILILLSIIGGYYLLVLYRKIPQV